MEADLQRRIKRYVSATATLQGVIKKFETQYDDKKAQEIISKMIGIINRNIQMDTKLDPSVYPILLDEYQKMVLRHEKFLSEKKIFEKEFRAYVFPGMGEKKKINPEGDYFIFHEMIELSKTINKDIVFLTNDTTKSDWIETKTGQNYIHYQTAFHILSNHAIKVRNYNEYIKTEIGIKTEKLLESNDVDYDDSFIGQYLLKWSQLERKVRIWATQNGLPEKSSIRQIFYQARGVGKIDDMKFENFLQLNEIRNNLVHGHYFRYQSISDREKDELLERIEIISSLF